MSKSKCLITNFAIFAGVVIALLAGSNVDPAAAAPPGAKWGPKYFPDYVVTTHEGKKVRFYKDLVENKIVIINFIYTTCADTCPLMTARMAEIQRRLGDAVGKRYFIYSVSLDPERDTPEKMKEHAEAYGIGPGWLFITGNPRELAEIRYKLGERSRSLAEHRTDMVIGNDHKGTWRRTSAFDDFDRAVLAIRSMDHQWVRKSTRKRRRIVSNYNAGARRISLAHRKQTGQALFQKACASCHTIGKGRKVGPDLVGISARRNREWLVNFIMHPDQMRNRGDPIAMTLKKQYPGTMMPYLGITKNDAADLLTYIELRTRSASTKAHNDKSKGQGKGG